MIFGKLPQAFGYAESSEVIALHKVVAGIVGRRPVADGIDVQVNLLRALRLADEHLAGWHESGDQFKLGVVQMERLAVEIAIHFWIGEEDLLSGSFLRRSAAFPTLPVL